jgi:outer membrane protein OmpA-like peptidoglycan-associated protein
MFFFVYSSHIVIAEDRYPSPDDQKTQEASEMAVKKLGPDKGAILIDSASVEIGFKSVDILGLKAVAISRKSVKVEVTLKELNAKHVGTEIQISLSGDVLFAFDKWDIRPEAEKTLLKIAKVIKELKKSRVRIEGHTDAKGPHSYNLMLSQKRADSIKRWFLEKGVQRNVVFTTKGHGESKPIAPNQKPDGSDNPEGRAKNRRVEIRLMS